MAWGGGGEVGGWGGGGGGWETTRGGGKRGGGGGGEVERGASALVNPQGEKGVLPEWIRKVRGRTRK